ncbi:hypothetical protein ACLKA6_014655 [Drosophila palustris]
MTASQNWKLETKEEVCGQGGDWQWDNRIGGNLEADLRHGSNNSSSSENVTLDSLDRDECLISHVPLVTCFPLLEQQLP